MRNFDIDVWYVQNPAIGAALLWRFTCGYYAKPQLNDDDKNAVRKIFECLSSFVKSAGFDIQIIVTEHADDDIWGNIPDSCIHLVEKWRNNVKLVPVEWL